MFHDLVNYKLEEPTAFTRIELVIINLEIDKFLDESVEDYMNAITEQIREQLPSELDKTVDFTITTDLEEMTDLDFTNITNRLIEFLITVPRPYAETRMDIPKEMSKTTLGRAGIQKLFDNYTTVDNIRITLYDKEGNVFKTWI